MVKFFFYTYDACSWYRLPLSFKHVACPAEVKVTQMLNLNFISKPAYCKSGLSLGTGFTWL